MVVTAKVLPRIKNPIISITILKPRTKAEIGILKKCSTISAIPVVPPSAIPEGRTKSFIVRA